jgi:hypothetical protein
MTTGETAFVIKRLARLLCLGIRLTGGGSGRDSCAVCVRRLNVWPRRDRFVLMDAHCA